MSLEFKERLLEFDKPIQYVYFTYTRGSITMTDREGLEARSCECYEIIQGVLARRFKQQLVGEGKSATAR